MPQYRRKCPVLSGEGTHNRGEPNADRRYQTASGQVLNAAQAISVRQALRAMTINAAWQLGIEQQAGSLEVGKWADLQIVDQSPYAVPTQRLSALKVDEVYLAGALQYRRD